jgi:predicted rRNA methylase YqxC with S4 and FtsJ domains
MDRKVRPEFSAVLSLERAREVCLEVCRRLEENGPCQVRAAMQSALKGKGGNLEFLLLLSPL